jgi:hypothetical protein
MPTAIYEADHIKARAIIAPAAENLGHLVVIAIAEERERCAKIADRLRTHSDPDVAHAAGAIADEIRSGD